MPLTEKDMQAAKEFGLRLKIARTKKQKTQLELTKKFNWAQSRVSQYENGLRRPSLDDARALAKELDVKVAWLMGEEKNEVQPSAGISEDLLASCIARVKEEATKQGIILSDAQIANTAAKIYSEVAQGRDTTDADVSSLVHYHKRFNLT